MENVRRLGIVGLCLMFGGGLAGCGGKTVTTGVQDQGLETRPTVAQSEVSGEPRSFAPSTSIPSGLESSQEDKSFGKPGALREARVAAQAAPPPADKAREVPAQTGAVAGLADVFFDYDRATLRPEAKTTLEANAQRLKTLPLGKLVLSGHCDERGTAAYNLVLGERRAQGAKRYLVDLGVPAAQLQVISYGKERPFCTEHSQACWQQNRRAHFAIP